MPYSVHLRDAGFDDDQREAAEVRYREKLERVLGGEEKTLEAYRRFDALCEATGKPTNAEAAFGKNWQEAIRDSIAAGFKGMSLPENFEGYFEIRLAR